MKDHPRRHAGQSPPDLDSAMPRRTHLGGGLLPKQLHPVIQHGKSSRDRMPPNGKQTRFGQKHDMASGKQEPNGQAHKTNGIILAMPNGLLIVLYQKAKEPTIRKGRVDPKGQKIRAEIKEDKPTVHIFLLPRMSSQARIQRRGISKGKLRPVRHLFCCMFHQQRSARLELLSLRSVVLCCITIAHFLVARVVCMIG